MIYWLKQKIPVSIKRKVKRVFRDSWQSVAYKINKSRFDKNKKIRHVVFICTGNICRSPFAEFALRQVVGNENVTIESCGTDVQKFVVSPTNAICVAQRFGVNLNNHYSKSYCSCNLEMADVIFSMDYGHYQWVLSVFPKYKNKTFLLRDFSHFPGNIACNIHDPLGMEEIEYNKIYTLIFECINRFSEECNFICE